MCVNVAMGRDSPALIWSGATKQCLALMRTFFYGLRLGTAVRLVRKITLTVSPQFQLIWPFQKFSY